MKDMQRSQVEMTRGFGREDTTKKVRAIRGDGIEHDHHDDRRGEKGKGDIRCTDSQESPPQIIAQ